MRVFAVVRVRRQPRRVASSVWLPWVAGTVLLLSLAVVTLVAGGRVEHGIRVPRAVLDGQQVATSTAAQAVRRSLNEGVDDLAAVATALSHQRVTQPSQLRAHLLSLADLHDRYRSLYVVDDRGFVVTQLGSQAHPAVLPPVVTEPGMNRALKVTDSEVIAQYAPLAGPGGARWVLAAEYDPAFLRFALDGVLPASAWVLDGDGRTVGATGDFTPFQRLGEPALRRAALQASDNLGYELGGRATHQQGVVAWAPAAGTGPAGSLGLGVVSARDLGTIVLPQTQAREQALLFGVLLLATSLGVFGWLYAMLIRPLQRLAQEAERLAYGDLRRPVEIRRYDEIGLMGRSLEHMRLVLLRQRMQPPADVGTKGRAG
jgi:HAMP domain-containing protein